MPFFQNSEFIWNIVHAWGSSNYRPSAPFLYEVASHVKNYHFGNYSTRRRRFDIIIDTDLLQHLSSTAYLLAWPPVIYESPPTAGPPAGRPACGGDLSAVNQPSQPHPTLLCSLQQVRRSNYFMLLTDFLH